MARAAARLGLRVLVVEVEERAGLAALLVGERAEELDYHERELVGGLGPDGAGSIHACTITAGHALLDYLDAHGMARVSKRLSRTGVFDVVSTAAPGIEDILVLGKVKQLERSGRYDLIVLDGPAAGHAIAFLQAASGLLNAVRMGPIETQARDVAELLADPQRCQVMLVTLAEETPVNELIETSFALEDRVGVALTPVVVNAVYPDRHLPPQTDVELERAAAFRRERCASQTAIIERLADELPLPQLRLPFVFTASLGLADVDLLTECLLEQVSGLE
jgi:anion-transporting  ArsA/GET3 family ATPase